MTQTPANQESGSVPPEGNITLTPADIRELDRIIKRAIIIGVSILGVPAVLYALLVVALTLANR